MWLVNDMTKTLTFKVPVIGVYQVINATKQSQNLPIRTRHTILAINLQKKNNIMVTMTLNE